MFSIGFKNLKVSCIIGVNKNERSIKQDIFIDLKIDVDNSLENYEDNLKNTIDYCKIVKICESVAMKNEFFLLETCALEISKEIHKSFNINGIKIRIKKPAAIPNASFSFVELKM